VSLRPFKPVNNASAVATKCSSAMVNENRKLHSRANRLLHGSLTGRGYIRRGPGTDQKTEERYGMMMTRMTMMRT
jgi:hypothetical protein